LKGLHKKILEVSNIERKKENSDKNRADNILRSFQSAPKIKNGVQTRIQHRTNTIPRKKEKIKLYKSAIEARKRYQNFCRHAFFEESHA